MEEDMEAWAEDPGDLTVTVDNIDGQYMHVCLDMENVNIIKSPKYTWKFIIGNGALSFMVEEDKVPCWFYRKMHTLILGIRWEKI